MNKAEKFRPLLNQIMGKKPELKVQDYFIFWEVLVDSAEYLATYWMDLLKSLVDIDKKSSKSSVASIVATICMCSMNTKNLDKQRMSQLANIEVDWKAHCDKSKKYTTRNPFSSDLFLSLIHFFSSKGDEYPKYIETVFTLMICLPPNIKDFSKDIDKLLKEKDPSDKEGLDKNLKGAKDIKFYLELSDFFIRCEAYQNNVFQESQSSFQSLYNEKYEIKETGDLSYLYDIFLNSLNLEKKNEGRCIPNFVINHISFFLKHLTYISSKYPKYAERSAVLLFHIMKQLILFNQIPNTEEEGKSQSDILKELITEVEIYRRWPFPVGMLAQELLNLLFSESKTPGNGLRSKLREDIPQIDFLVYDSAQKERKGLQIAHCFCDEMDELTMLLINQSQNKYSIGHFSMMDPHRLRIMLISHLYKIHEKDDQEFMRHLTCLDEKSIFIIYCRVMNIIEKCEDLDSLTDIKSIQEKALEELKKEIAEKPERDEIDKEINTLFEIYPNYLPGFPPCYLQCLGGFKSSPQQKTELVIEFGRKSTKYNYGFLSELLREIKQINLPLHQEPLRLVLFGGDQEIQSFVQEFGDTFYKEYQLFLGVDIRVFLIPTKFSALANYFASQDLWYCRNIYSPFYDENILPKLDQSEGVLTIGKDIAAPSDRMILPIETKENLIQTFLREGVRKIPVKVFEIQCFRSTSGVVIKPDEFIYFCEYMQLGACVEAEKLKQNKKSANDNYFELKEKGQLKFSFIELDIKTVCVDLLGNEVNKDTVRVQVHNLKANNIYTDYFEGNAPSPNTSYLELNYIDFENSKQHDKNLKHKMMLKKFNREQIQNAFFSLHVSIPVSYLEITDFNNKGFHIMVDGKMFGPFVMIKVAPLSNEKKDLELSIPFMTFLPIEL